MKNINILSIMFFLLFPLICSSQVKTLPIQNFIYPKDVNYDQPYFVTLQKPYTVYSSPKLNQESKLRVINKNNSIILVELIFIDDLLKEPLDRIYYNTNEVILVRYHDIEGYINLFERRPYLSVEESIYNWYKAHKDRYFTNKRTQRENYLKVNYGDSIGLKLTNLEFKLGMTKDMIMAAMGEPNDINVTQGEFGKHEQIVYKNFYNLNYNYGYQILGGPIYFYIENGKLTTVQY